MQLTIKNISFLFLLSISSLSCFCCTTFVLKDSTQLVFGRNLDWVSDDGLVMINKRDVKKTSLVFPPEKATNWTSKYGSVTFNQFGKEFPFGGMNEKGLVVELMLIQGKYPKLDKRTAVNELQWVQYQLDNSSTVNQVVLSDKSIRISKINQHLHFLVCDSLGSTAVIEFSEKGMSVYQNESLPIPVLENDRYSTSLIKHKNRKKCRFSTAASMLDEYPSQGNSKNSEIIDYSLDVLDRVALSGSWSIVYDLAHMTIYFKTASRSALKKIKLDTFNFNCSAKSLAFDLKRKENRDISHLFVEFDHSLNTKKLASGIKSNQIKLPPQMINQFYNYHKRCSCKVN